MPDYKFKKSVLPERRVTKRYVQNKRIFLEQFNQKSRMFENEFICSESYR